MTTTVVEDLVRGTQGINNIEQQLKALGAIESSEEVPIEQFPERINSVASSVSDNIAPQFSEEQKYNENNIVFYNGDLYKFNVDHYAGPWTGSDATQITIGSELNSKISISDFAETFNEYTYYTKGQIVICDNVVCRFLSDHPAGPLDWSEVFMPYKLSEFISRSDSNITFSVDGTTLVIGN